MQPILDVAIGLAFIYALAALVITAMTEFLATLLRLRSGMLETGIKQLLRDPKLAEEFYKHPLITVLSQPSPITKTRRPSYIPSKTFALTLADILDGDAGWKAEIARRKAAKQAEKAPPVVAAAVPQPAKDSEEVVVPPAPEQTPGPRAKSTAAPAQPSAPAAPPTDLQRVLFILWQDSGEDVAAFRRALEGIFDDAMDRVSGWYKRRADRIVFALGIFLTLLLNIDTISIVRTLWNEPALRTAMVNEATAYVNEEAKKKAATEEATPATAPKGPPDETPDVQPAVTLQDLERQRQSVDAAFGKLRSISFPLGWAELERDPERRKHLESITQGWEKRYEHALGWLLSVFALSLGAPFWFDILSKLVSIRTAGKNPQEKKERETKEPQAAAIAVTAR